MSIVRYIVVDCDCGCPEGFRHCVGESDPAWTVAEVREETKGFGWVKKNGLDFCPPCVEREHHQRRPKEGWG
jgi:hypothetical protein